MTDTDNWLKAADKRVKVADKRLEPADKSYKAADKRHKAADNHSHPAPSPPGIHYKQAKNLGKAQARNTVRVKL